MSGISQNPKTFLPTGKRIKKNYISILAQDIGAVNLFYTIYSHFSLPVPLSCAVFFQMLLVFSRSAVCQDKPDLPVQKLPAARQDLSMLFLFPAGILAALFPENAAVAIICQRLPYPVQLFLCTYDFHAQTPLYHHTPKRRFYHNFFYNCIIAGNYGYIP